MSLINIAVVIPCFCVRDQILLVIDAVPDNVKNIYIIDDCCPENTGIYVQKNRPSSRICIIQNKMNYGVGGAVLAGYKAALDDGADIVVKIDGDGQMDPSLIKKFIFPIVNGDADYTKGNRFYDLENIGTMPRVRLIGNSILSFFSKLSTGYWNIFDPANGYTAIHKDIIKKLPFEKISKRYFFESDLLFHLNIMKAVVVDIPMDAKYENEKSNLKVRNILLEFAFNHTKNFIKRIFYNYYLRDMSVASFELPIGIIVTIFGLIYGCTNWYIFSSRGIPAPTGTIVISAISILFGIQMLLAFLTFDIASTPKRPIHPRIREY